MVRSFDMNQFNNKFHQDFTRSTHIKSTQIGGKVKKGPIDSKLINGASTFGDYQKASTTNPTSTNTTKKPSSTAKTPTAPGEISSKAKTSTTKKSTSTLAKGQEGSSPEGKTMQKVEKDSGTSKTKKPAGTTGAGTSGQKNWQKTSMKDMPEGHTVEEQDEEDDGYDYGKNKAGDSDNSDPMMGINVYSMGNKAMFTGKK